MFGLYHRLDSRDQEPAGRRDGRGDRGQACGRSTLKPYVRLDERHIELRPESTNPDHRPIAIDLKLDPFEIAGIAVGALIGDGFNRPGYETWSA